MSGADVSVAWWGFWLVLGIVLFGVPIWTFYRLAVWSDQISWREFVERHTHRDTAESPPAQRAVQDTQNPDE